MWHAGLEESVGSLSVILIMLLLGKVGWLCFCSFVAREVLAEIAVAFFSRAQDPISSLADRRICYFFVDNVLETPR